MKRRTFVKSTLSAAALASVPVSRGFGFELPAITSNGAATTLTQAEIRELAKSLTLALLTPDSHRYHENRKIWNGMWDDKHPALIVQCMDVSDVINAVNFARTHDLLLAVRGGGHSISGKSVCHGGMVIDLSYMRSVQIDPYRKTARVGGGALLSDLDRAAQRFGLVTPSGVVSHTGVAGLTLGGGIGRLMRKYGLTIDNLLSVEIVTPDGRLQRASDQENADLFWAVRGGGGNFGVVTAFEFRLHSMGTEILSCGLAYPLDQAKDVFKFYFDFSREMPDELHFGLSAAIQENGDSVGLFFGLGYSGSLKEAERIIEPIRKFGKPSFETIGMRNFVELQSMGDAHNEHGRAYYIKGRHMNDFDPDMVDPFIEQFQHAPSRFTVMRIVRFGGAIERVAKDATAWPHRDAKWDFEVGGSWPNPDLSEKYVQWGRDYWKTLDSYMADTFYVNELMDEGQSHVNTNYQGNYKRLSKLKQKYDPRNLFRLNANIEPSG